MTRLDAPATRTPPRELRLVGEELVADVAVAIEDFDVRPAAGAGTGDDLVAGTGRVNVAASDIDPAGERRVVGHEPAANLAPPGR